jgi:exo-rhamnogalacturonan lyase-like protein
MQRNGGVASRRAIRRTDLPAAERGGSTGRVLVRFAALVLALAAVRATAAVAPLAVPLVVEEPAGVIRRAWPASASVPFPSGRVRAPDALWLAAPGGAPTPSQTRVLERWPDGSVRWLLIDFLVDVPAGERATYTLRDTKKPRAAAAPHVRLETGRDGSRTLDTGALRVSVPARGDTLLTGLAAGHARVAGPVALPALTVDGATNGRPASEHLAVETEGAVRTELLLTGRYPQGLTYEVRIAAFAGQPFLRVRHTITDMADAHYAQLRSLALTVPGHFTAAATGIDDGERTLELDAPHELLHTDATPALLDGERAGRHADGWMRADGGGAAVTLVAPDFWAEYPKALRVAPERIAIDLFAGREAPVPLGTGAAKTHEFWIVVEDAEHASRAPDLAAALVSPLVALPPASWIVASRALPQALDPDGPGARDFLARLATAHARSREKARTERWDDGPPVPCSERTSEHPRIGLYGALNWGDWQFPGYRDHIRGCDGWGNLEYDLPQVLALGWAATGSRAFFDGLVPAARHYRDVDIIHHFPGHPDWVGMNHPHKALHFAVEAKETIDLGHTWTEGLVTFYRLTGEVRALAAARGIADALVGREYRARNPRQFGWPMLALIAVYDASGERRYLDAARAYASAGSRLFRPTPAAGDWKMGILADGLAAVHAANPDDGLRRWLVAYADVFVADPGRWPDPRYALPLGYLAALTGDARYERVALATARSMKIGEWGKPLAAMGRTGFRLLAPLARDPGERNAPPAERRARPQTRPRRASSGDG